MGQIEWSPNLQATRLSIEVWDLLTKRLSGRKVSIKHLQRKAKSAGIHISPEIDIKKASEMRIAALRRYYKSKSGAAQLRTTFLENLAEAIAIKEDRKKGSIIRQLKEREVSRNTFRRIKRNLGKTQDCRLRTVLATNLLGNQVEYVKRADVEAACVEEAVRRFTQARLTPFYMSHLLDIFGYVALQAVVEQVMNGTFIPPPGTN